MALSPYQSGTVAIENNSPNVVGTGTIWTDMYAREGDDITIGAARYLIIEIVDPTHLIVDRPIGLATASGLAYKIWRNSSQRVDGAEQAENVSRLVSAFEVDGFMWFVDSDETEPDPSVGNEGQYAEQPSSGKKWVKQGGVWVYLGISDPVFSRYDLTLDLPGRPESGAVVARWIMPSQVTFDAGLPQTIARAFTASAATAVFTLRRANGVQIGTLTFAAGNLTPSISAPSLVTCAAGVVVELVAPAIRDETLADLVFTIVGQR